MDFTPDLSALQGVLVSADNVHSFSTLSAMGGYEKEIKYIIDRIQFFLESENYISNDGIVQPKIKNVKKLAFYLILNSDLATLMELVEIEDLEMVIWTIPTISKCLMCEIFWNLKFDPFLYEIIVFTNPKLSIEVSAAFVESIKYFNPTECHAKLKLLASAIFRFVCRIHFMQIEKNKLINTLNSAYDTFQKCLKYFSHPPNGGKLNNMKKDEVYKFTGHNLSAMLLLLSDCLNNFSNEQTFSAENFDPMYLLTLLDDSYNSDPLSYKICESPNELILDTLNKCLVALLDKCKELVMDVSVDIFCAWSEFEENSKSMQEKIGEIAFEAHSNLTKCYSIADHPVISMLQQISRKPKEVKDLINSMDVDTIIENLANDENQEKYSWIQGLLYKDDLCQNASLLNNLASNLQLLNEEDSLKLYKILARHLKTQNENKNLVWKLSVKTFQKCSLAEKYEIIDETFKEKVFVDSEDSEDFDNVMTEIFNKLVATPDADLTDVLILFLLNPEQVYKKIFTIASENSQQCSIMLKLISLLKKYSDHFYSSDMESCVIKITKTMFTDGLDTEPKQRNFVNFIHGLKIDGIIPDKKLLLLVIMPLLHSSLLSKNIMHIQVQIKLLSVSYAAKDLFEYKAPVLAMLAQVLDIVRWKIITYDPQAPTALEHCINFQKLLFEAYQKDLPEKEITWLKSKLRSLQPLNMYYYRQLWNPPGSTFVEIVSGTRVYREMDIEQLIFWLSQVLCSSIKDEWCEIWNSLEVFGDGLALDIISNALSVTTRVELPNRTDATWACLMHCYRNFVYVIRYKFLKQPLSDGQVAAVVRKITSIANQTPEDRIEELGTTVLPLVAYISEKRQDYMFDVHSNFRSKIKSEKLNTILGQVFANGTS